MTAVTLLPFSPFLCCGDEFFTADSGGSQQTTAVTLWLLFFFSGNGFAFFAVRCFENRNFARFAPGNLTLKAFNFFANMYTQYGL